jgi:dienelactone hydrolase
MTRRLIVLLCSAAALLTTAPAAPAFDGAREAANYAKILERSREYLTPSYQVMLRAATVEGAAGFAALLASDPTRSPLTLCASHLDACAGDVRLYRWGAAPGEHVQAVHFTARTGALLSGHVFTYGEPGRPRPGVVITPGSVQVIEEHYWWAAQTLARHGYTVLAYDIQSQGKSDVLGTGPDPTRNAAPQSMPSFVENTEDALHFLRSTPDAPYAPVTEPTACHTEPGTAEAASRQRTRVAAGRADAFNPLHAALDRTHVALAGHSYGTLGPAIIGQCEPSVRATVAWDYLRAGPGTDQGFALPAPKVPGLGISQDYGLPATPYTSNPDPEAKNVGFTRYVRAGVDVMQLTLRGATHTDWTYLPNPAFGASLRGLDLGSWYTLAWLDRYVKRDPTALKRLLTNRWRDDHRGAAVDLRGDGNLFSFYYRSRIAITQRERVRRRVGKKRRSVVVARPIRCDDVRGGCPALVPRAADGHPGDWSYLAEIGVS